MNAVPSEPISSIVGDIERCISRAQGLSLMAEALLNLDRRAANAFAMAADDLEQHLIGIRDRLHVKVLDGRAAS